MRRRPVVVTRGRPGIAGTMARTAVIAGTATVVSKGVSGAMSGGKQQAAAQQAAAQQAATQQAQTDSDQQAQIDQMQAQVEAMQAQQAQTAMPGPDTAQPATSDVIAQLQQLTEMKSAGMLSDEEFATLKAKLLAS